jgi:predicted GNAT family N-acyltransferase
VLENDREIIGFINSGATDNVVLSDEAFKELIGHDPAGRCIVIMSVAVHPDYQGQGMANVLMKGFISAMKALNKAEIYLICQDELVALYARYGFELIGPSASAHGGMQWQEMSLAL